MTQRILRGARFELPKISEPLQLFETDIEQISQLSLVENRPGRRMETRCGIHSRRRSGDAVKRKILRLEQLMKAPFAEDKTFQNASRRA